MVPERYLEIVQYTGEGFMPLVDYGAWRVAVLRFTDELLPERIEIMEQHHETDEVFILLGGRCILFFLGTGRERNELYAEDMKPLKAYNVRRGALHSHTLTEDATILIVENRGTGTENSTKVPLSSSQREWLQETSARLWGDLGVKP